MKLAYYGNKVNVGGGGSGGSVDFLFKFGH